MRRAETIRAFISYSTKDKLVGADVKRALGDFGIEGFLAHDDVRISEEWKTRILEELDRCNVFVPLLSKAFQKSDWAPQETAIAFARQTVLIIPLSLDGTIPFGFVSHLQAKKIPNGGVSRHLFQDPLLKRFPRQIIPQLIKGVERASTFRIAEGVVGPLVSIFPLFTKSEAVLFATAAARNGQVWSASLCRKEYLPAFLRRHSGNLPHRVRKALAYEIEHDKPFPGVI